MIRDHVRLREKKTARLAQRPGRGTEGKEVASSERELRGEAKECRELVDHSDAYGEYDHICPDSLSPFLVNSRGQKGTGARECLMQVRVEET